MLDTLWRDLRFALRTLRRSPGFALVVVLTLALGTGANTAIFSVVQSVLLKPLPYPQDDQLVQVWSTGAAPGPMRGRFALSYQEIQNVGGLHDDLSGLGAYTETRYNLTGVEAPREVQAELASPALFQVLGVHPALGHLYTDAQMREPVVVLSNDLWVQLFGRDSTAVGRTLTLDGRDFTVVGVMPQGFAFPDEGAQLWAPLGLAFVTRPEMETNPNFHAINAVARLRDGARMDRLRADLAVLAARTSEPAPGPASGGGRRVEMVQRGGPPPGGASGPKLQKGAGAKPPGFVVQRLRDEVVGDARTPLLVLLAVVGFVLIIACVNAANLLLARASARGQELAVRRALGAGRSRLVRQVLTESVLLALAGGFLGVVFARLGLSAILAAWPAVLPRTQAVGLNAATLGFALLISLLTGIAFGLAPALRSSAGPETSLHEAGLNVTAGPARHRLQRGLVIVEIALALVVLTGAGLLVRSFVRLNEVDPGYNTHGVLTARIRLTPARYQQETQRLDFFRRVMQELKQQPGVETASVAQTLPMSGQVRMLAFDPRRVRPDDPEPFLAVGMGMVGPDFFRTLHVPLLAGRTFTDQDREGGQRVAIVNKQLADRLWPGENAVGRTIPLPMPGQLDHGPSDVTVVGEIGDVHYASLTDPVKPEIYMPFAQVGGASGGDAWVIARATGDPLALAAAVRRAVHNIDPEQPVASLTTLARMASRSTASRRFNMTLVSLFALLALGLAIIGIYGVTAYAVEQRTREIGVRMAVGAARPDVLRLVLGETALTAGVGIVLGLAGALAATRVLASLLFQVSATDTVTFVVTALVLAAAALLAAAAPALRASNIDPVRALRE